MPDFIDYENRTVSFDYAARVNSINNSRKTIELLKTAGACRVLIGVESFYNNTLAKWKKGVECEEIQEAIIFLKSIQMGVC